jgi:hypothetical protein
MASLWSKFVAGIRGFREAWMSSGTPLDDSSDFGDWDARCVRYAVLWGYYDSTVYRNIHTWAAKLRSDYGLYRYTRSIYNPAARLAEFWQTHVWGGALDAFTSRSGVPLLTEFPELRVAVDRLWLDSNWQVNKDICTLWGAVLGDAAIRVVDDVGRQRVYLENVHPSTVREVTLDAFGNVKGYVLEEPRDDPRAAAPIERQVTYREEVTREGDLVIFKTSLNGSPYAWNEIASEWAEPYGFCPLVLIQHNNVGAEWGWSEFATGLSKIREVDDIASKLSDQIRKTIDPVWMFSGMEKPRAGVTVSGATPSTLSPEPGRQELPALYAPLGAVAHPLVAPLDVGGTLAHVTGILNELERDYAELQMVRVLFSPGASGRAREIAQQAVEPKVIRRRASYDDALRRAQQMAISIGGYRGYEAYKPYTLESYSRGLLEHRIGPRSVFARTPADELEEEALFWQTAAQAQTAGCPLPLFLKRRGWSDERIAEFVAWRQAEQQAAAAITSAGGENEGQ